MIQFAFDHGSMACLSLLYIPKFNRAHSDLSGLGFAGRTGKDFAGLCLIRYSHCQRNHGWNDSNVSRFRRSEGSTS